MKNGSKIPHIKRNFKVYLDVLICRLQSLYNIMHGHCVPEDAQDQEMTNDFDLFGITSSYAANVESIVFKAVFSLSNGLVELRP